MRQTFYIRSRGSGEIINSVTGELEGAQRVLDAMNERQDHYYLDAFPPDDVLGRYRYFRERP